MKSQKVEKRVIPAKAGIHKVLKLLDFPLRGNDIKKRYRTFCEVVKAQIENSLQCFFVRISMEGFLK